MFDSPLEWCTECRNWIALDQTLRECARQNGCVAGACPLEALLRRPSPATANRSTEKVPGTFY